jgi:hypothetical protein
MIKHIKCDIFESGADVICHQVNCQGVMGSGIAKQVREKYPWVYAHYKQLCKNFRNRKEDLLGMVQGVYIDEETKILNLYAQLNYGYDGKCYTNYDALKKALMYISSYYHRNIIAIPYLMGCYRGGGDWNVVYKMIEEIFADSDCDVLICEYNGG